jgi:non-homologous end joining protein Ku
MAIYYSNPELKDVCQIAWKDKNSMDIWMTFNQWLKPIPIYAENVNDLPEALKAVVIKRQKEVSVRKDTFEAEWYVKQAKINFIYENDFYSLLPHALNASQELFESISDEIEMELTALGSPLTLYMGMLD